VQSCRSLWTNVAGEAWRAAGTGRRRAMCLRSWVMKCAGSTGFAAGVNSSPGIRRGSPYTSSATDACRSALYAVRTPSRTNGSASVHCWSAWHMMAAFSVRWKRSTRPLAAGCWAVVLESWVPHILAMERNSCDSNWRPWSVVIVCGQPKRDIQLAMRARATVSAVMSGIGIASGQRVAQGTMAAGLDREETRVSSVVASCRLMAWVTPRFRGLYPLSRESVPVSSARSHVALRAVGERTDCSGRNRHRVKKIAMWKQQFEGPLYIQYWENELGNMQEV
jgi:hypothetical protein